MAFSKTAIAAFLALSAVVSAVPVDKRQTTATTSAAASSSEPPTAMGRPSSSGSAPSSSETIVNFASGDDGQLPLANSFPNVTNPSDELTAIFDQAHGTLPQAAKGAPKGAPPHNETLISLQLIRFNENWEVYYFTELYNNISKAAPGSAFDVPDPAVKEQLLKTLVGVQAQEELHALNAGYALTGNGQEDIQACKYQAPGVTDWKSGLMTAITFTDVVLGTLGDVQTLMGFAGDSGLIRGVAAVIGQEGEQNGYYRSALNVSASALPFLTASAREFAFSALNQAFVVPGSCPNSNIIDLPVFAALTVETENIQAETQNLTFQFTSNDAYSYSSKDADSLSLVYINQQNAPIVYSLDNVAAAGDNGFTFTAEFPYEQYEMNSLTIAAVVKGAGPFNNITAVAENAVAGPGLIEILI